MVTGPTPQGRSYRILEVIGRGGFGTVYRAELLGSGGFTKQVAIKVLNGDAGAPAEVILRLRDEARILGLLRHRAIVGVDNLAEFDQGWAVIMEYVPGADLSAVIRGGPMPATAALEVVEEVAAALHAAWEITPEGHGAPLRLVHRDLKPSNIRVTAQGEVKVLDFGVARAEFSAREAHTSNYLFGSLKYMGIERLEGVEGPAGDVYALGLVLAELLLGRDLPEPPRHPERFARYLDGLCGELPAEGGAPLVGLIRSMLADNAEIRPSALEVERCCRGLRQGCTGPWLREWASQHVPRLAEDRTQVQRSPESGSILIERTGTVGAAPPTRVDGAPGGSTLRPSALAIGVAAGAGLGLLALGFAWALRDRADAAPAVATAPIPPAPPSAAPAQADPEAPGPAASPAPDPASPAQSATPGPGSTAPPPRAVAHGAGAGAAVAHVVADEAALVATPTPVAPEPADAELLLVGDARSVWLVSADGRYPAGRVPPGTYEIKAWFDGPDPAVAGSVSLHAGERVTLRCVGAMARCARVE